MEIIYLPGGSVEISPESFINLVRSVVPTVLCLCEDGGESSFLVLLFQD